MKTNNMYNKESRLARFPYAKSIKSVVLIAFGIMGVQTTIAQTQDTIKYSKPTWLFGVAAGANLNYHRGSTQQLNADLIVPTRFQNGSGVGLYVAPLIEFHPTDSHWSVMLQAGYDKRSGKFDQVTTPCNCPADLKTDLGYITVEPSLRFSPFKSNFYIYAGPRFAFNMSKSFTYQLGLNPAIPNQAITPAVEGDFSDINNNIISMQVGAGYDIPLSSQSHRTQFVLSPFVSFQPYFGQNPRSIETWNLTTIRVGAALKLGRGHKIESKVKEQAFAAVVAEPEVKFYVDPAKNTVAVTNVREVFPLGNYVYFDLGSTEIPKRYVLLQKDQVKDFRQDQVELTTPENFSGRSSRQMIVYYNVLNIIGDRMVKNPNSTIRMIGSSEQGPKDGHEMAESTK